MFNYKVWCINLERRVDRREAMAKILGPSGLEYEFFKAVDGTLINANDPRLNLLKHSIGSLLRHGIAGCALSHYQIWSMMLSDTYDAYVVLEDDLILCPDFKLGLERIMGEGPNPFTFIGMTTDPSNLPIYQHKYIDDKSFSVHPLDRSLFCGGAFGYIITKEGAQYLVDYIQQNGIRMVIDYLVYNSGVGLFESHPHLVFTQAVQYAGNGIDSDIQKTFTKISFNKLPNNQTFGDYVFYPNLDSAHGDIREVCADIQILKKLADSTPNCVAFNTHGWLKYHVRKNLSRINDRYYEPDGIYIKKSYLSEDKMTSLKRKVGEEPIKIFVNEKALLYAKNIVKMIIRQFPSYDVVSHDETYDLSINHLVEPKYISPSALNILISGEPWTIPDTYDMVIDTKYNTNLTKYNSNLPNNIYYPVCFSSLCEHRKSIDPRSYVKPKSKFCAYMYQMSYEHRVRYFHLVSTYKKVDALGKCCNNVPINNTRSEYGPNQTYNDIAVEYYSEYKFVLAIEAKWLRGYSTEKLMNVLLANSVPIYWGDPEIFQYINKKRVIYAPDFEDEKLLQYIKSLDLDADAYDAILKESMYVDPNFSPELFEKDVERAIRSAFGFD